MSSGQAWWADHEKYDCKGADCWCTNRAKAGAPDVHVAVSPEAIDECLRASPMPSVRTPLRILCDCDGVLADFVGLVLDYVRNKTGLSYRPEAVDQWDCFKCLGLSEHWPYFRDACDGLELCRSMREVVWQLPGGLVPAHEFFAELERIAGDPARVVVCTTPMTVSWLSQRAAWLEAFGVPLARQKHTHDKADLVGAWDVLIDDKAEHCADFTRAGGVAFCIATPYNTHLADLPGGAAIARGSHADCLRYLRNLAGET